MNYNELLELVHLGEGYTIEFKESLSSSIGKEICAFANATGGKIIIGVKDDGTIKGYILTNTDKSKIQDIAHNMDPSLHLIIEQISNLVLIYIPQGKEKPYTVNGLFYLRLGANSQQLKRNEIRGLFQKENMILFDIKENLNFDNNDFNIDAFDRFVNKSGIDNDLSKEHILKNIGFITDNKLNNAGVLFFSRNIGKYFLNSTIGCVLYAGKTKTKILDKQELETDFISNLNNAVTFVLRNLRTEYIIEKIERYEKPEISEEILRELIINAMIHRDYFSNGRLLIEIFSDRVEISNPGGLLFDKSEFGKRSFARNPLLADLVPRLRLVEKVGSGINRVKDLLKKDVKFELFSDWFRVIIFRKDTVNNGDDKYATSDINGTVNGTVNDTVKLVLDEIKKNPNITYDELESKIDKSRRTIIRIVNSLKKKDIIKRVGSDKTGHWEFIKK